MDAFSSLPLPPDAVALADFPPHELRLTREDRGIGAPTLKLRYDPVIAQLRAATLFLRCLHPNASVHANEGAQRALTALHAAPADSVAVASLQSRQLVEDGGAIPSGIASILRQLSLDNADLHQPLVCLLGARNLRSLFVRDLVLTQDELPRRDPL